MRLDTGWLALGALVLFVAWLGWTALRRRPPPAPPRVGEPAMEEVALPGIEAAAADPAPVVAAPPPAPVKPAPSPPEKPPVAPPPAVTPAPAPTAVVQPASEPPPIARPAVRPTPPRFERVLGIEASEASLWSAAEPVPLSPAQAEAVAAAFAALEASRQGDAEAAVAIAFAAGSMLRIARVDLEIMKSLSAEHQSATARVLGWLDSKAASSLAASLLAALASARHLDALHGEVQSIKAAIAALPPKLGQADGGLKTLGQDLSRYLREARENYAALVAKAAFRERIEESCARMLALWHEIDARLAGRRLALASLATAPRFGEAQVERALAELRELAEQRRLQLLASRVLAALNVLRASAGAAAHGGDQALRSAAASLRAAASEERDLAERLRTSERAAQGDPYVGKAEFEAHRAALRKLLDGFGGGADGEGIERLEAASAAAAEGFPEGAGGDDRWLVRLDVGGAAVEVRRSRVTRLH